MIGIINQEYFYKISTSQKYSNEIWNKVDKTILRQGGSKEDKFYEKNEI